MSESVPQDAGFLAGSKEWTHHRVASYRRYLVELLYQREHNVVKTHAVDPN